MLAGFALSCQAADPVRLVRIEKNPEQYLQARLLGEIYRRLDLTVEVQAVPPARASLLMNNHQVDGEVARSQLYAASHPALIRLMPSFYTQNLGVYSIRPISIKSQGELKQYRIGVLKDFYRYDELGIQSAQMKKALDFKELLWMLKHDDIDLVIESETNLTAMAHKYQFGELQPVWSLPDVPLYHYLQPDQTITASRLAALISQLKQSGELERLRQQYQQELLQMPAEQEF